MNAPVSNECWVEGCCAVTLTTPEIGTVQAGEDEIAAMGQTLPVGTPCLVKCRQPLFAF